MPALEKQRAIARSHPPIGVPRGVADDIGLGLDNATADDALGQLAHHELANEIAGEGGGVDWQLGARKRRRRLLVAGGLQAIRSTHCAREGPGLERVAEILGLARDLALPETP